MIGFWLNLVAGIVIAAALFGGVLLLVGWLYRLSFGASPRLPVLGVGSLQAVVVLIAFALLMAAGGIYLYSIARADWVFWNAYTLPKHQVIDYVLSGLLLMPALYWFIYSALASPSGRKEQAPLAEPSDEESGQAS